MRRRSCYAFMPWCLGDLFCWHCGEKMPPLESFSWPWRRARECKWWRAGGAR